MLGIAARARAQLHDRSGAARARCRRRSRSCSSISPARGARGRTARSISCCSPSGRTTSIFPGSSPTSSSMRPRERVLFGRGVIQSVEAAESALTRSLPANFAQIARGAEADGRRRSLARRVRLVRPSGVARRTARPAPAGRRASTCIRRSSSTASGCARFRNSSARASCRSSRRSRSAARRSVCANPATDRMTFVDAHQQAFAGHGVCARSEQDPEFDRACFMADGKSFAASPVEGATEPLTCGRSRSRSFAPTRRARAGSAPRTTAISSR